MSLCLFLRLHGLQITAAEFRKIIDRGVFKKLGRNTGLHILGLRLHGFFADLEALSKFIAHSPGNPAHANCTGLARVRTPQSPVKLKNTAGLFPHPKRISNGRPSSPGFDFGFCHELVLNHVLKNSQY